MTKYRNMPDEEAFEDLASEGYVPVPLTDLDRLRECRMMLTSPGLPSSAILYWNGQLSDILDTLVAHGRSY